MDSMDHDLYSFAEISRAFGISPDILLAYQGDNFEFDTLAGLPCEAQEVMSEGAIAPISIAILVQDGHYHFNSAFRSDLYEDSPSLP